MKKILTIAALVAVSTVASYSQGLVSIALSSGSLISTNGTAIGKATGASAFYYELLVSSTTTLPSSANQIVNSNNYTANSANLALWSDSTVTGVTGTGINAGKITAGGSVAASGWTAPSGAVYDNTMSYIIVGWSSNYGTTWNAVASLLNGAGLSSVLTTGFFGTTAVGLNYAGGGPSGLPAVNLWGNQTGTPGYGVTGLTLNLVPVPEPATFALAGLGGLALLAFRRRK